MVSVLVGVKDGRMVANQGDPDAPVNRGLNCIKGYFLTKIMYGKDRLTQPLMRMKDGKFVKKGKFQPVSWEQAEPLELDFDALESAPVDQGRFAELTPTLSRAGNYADWEKARALVSSS